MSPKKCVRFMHITGFAGCSFTTQISINACQLEYRSFDPKTVRTTLGRPVKHKENLFVFLLDREKAIRVNTRKKRIWLGNGKPMVKKFLESV